MGVVRAMREVQPVLKPAFYRRAWHGKWRCGLCGKGTRAEHVHICPRCGSVARLVLDHDHRTGKPRAFVCRPCNAAIGHYEHRDLYPKESALTEAYLSEYGPK